MNTTATETTTVVRIGKGLTLHAQAKGVDAAAAACGTVSRSFGGERRTTGIVSCRKCLDTIAANEALEAQEAREAEMAAEEAPIVMQVIDHEAEWAARLVATVEATTPAFETVRYEDQHGLAAVLRVPVAATTATEAPADCMGGFVKGDHVATKDGRVWHVEGPAQGNTTAKLTLVQESQRTEAKTVTTYRFARNLTKA